MRYLTTIGIPCTHWDTSYIDVVGEIEVSIEWCRRSALSYGHVCIIVHHRTALSHVMFDIASFPVRAHRRRPLLVRYVSQSSSRHRIRISSPIESARLQTLIADRRRVTRKYIVPTPRASILSHYSYRLRVGIPSRLSRSQ